jgi:hypothetical protein
VPQHHAEWSKAGRQQNHTVLVAIWYKQHLNNPYSRHLAQIILSILYNVTYFKCYTSNSIFYMCKLVLIFYAIHSLKNTSLKMVPMDGKNMEVAYKVYSWINPYIFTCTCWFYSHNESAVQNHKLFKIDKTE